MRWWPFGNRDGSDARGSSRAALARDERLSAYLDDDLTAEDRAAVEAELLTDDTLRDELAGMRAITGALASLEPVRAPRPFTLEAAPTPAGRPRILDLGLQLGAAVSALLLVVVIVNPGGGGGLGDAIPVEQSRTGETALQFSAGNDDSDAGAAAAGGGAAAPEAAPSDGGEESGGGEGSSPPPTEGLRSDMTPSAASGSSGASSGSDTGEVAPAQITPAPPADASTADAPPGDAPPGDSPPADTTTSDNDDGSTKTPPPPAETGPGTPPSTGDAANSGGATTIEPQPAGGDADTTAVEPQAGTEEAIAASDLGGDDGTDFVPAFAVLTALLTALAALRWTQTRRTA